MKSKKKKRNHSIHVRGIPVSSGIVQASIYLIEKTDIQIPHYWISNKELASESQRFKTALEKTEEQLKKIKYRLCRYGVRDQIHILDSYSLILQDEMLTKNTLNSIKSLKINAEWALQKTLDRIKQVFLDVDKEYFRERKSDVDYIGDRLLKNLVGTAEDSLSGIPPNSIIVAHDLSPADTAQLVKFKIGGFVTEMGGKTSHTAIVARALQIPAIVACSKILQKAQTGDTAIIDATKGIVILHPTEAEKKVYDFARKKAVIAEKKLLKEIHFPAETKDQFRIHLAANMELTEEIDSIKEHGAEGVGLYRTEFLYLNREKPPTEEEQFENYRKVLKAMYPSNVTIRTLDIGADKVPTEYQYEREINPALGMRAIRLSLREKNLFRTQLRALLRASVFGKLRLMFPMISTLEELRQSKQILQEVQKDLSRKKIEYDPHVKIGVMIEVPAAVMIAEELAKEVNFFSIGTNDLIQYTLAIDRANENVAYLYRPLHLAVLRMLKKVVDAAHQEKIEVGVCGEMASEPLYILILLGLGFTELSMNAISIPRVKRIIRSVLFKEAKGLLDKILLISNEAEIENVVKKEMNRFMTS